MHAEPFATARFARTRLMSGELVQDPTAEIHAKVMGTTLTLCGESALSWFKFWGQPFESVTGDRCSKCDLIVRSHPPVPRPRPIRRTSEKGRW